MTFLDETRNGGAQVLKGMSNNIEKFNQEYCVQFLGSSNTLINGQALADHGP
jgi:hypothetical protein